MAGLADYPDPILGVRNLLDAGFIQCLFCFCFCLFAHVRHRLYDMLLVLYLSTRSPVGTSSITHPGSDEPLLTQVAVD